MATLHKNNKLSKNRLRIFRENLLKWYDKNRRDLPWRAPAGQKPDPYHEWLSEIMLQQTTVAAVIPYFLKFIKQWPDIHALAKASPDAIMKEWAGLGYYARARNLHDCAKIVSKDLNGVFPDNEKELKSLPGIGDYTAAAIAAIAFDKPATVVDGNVERVIARYFAIEKPLPGVRASLKKLAAPFFEQDNERPGDLAQAFMELGATVCVPSSPRCEACPVEKSCAGRAGGIESSLPKKMKKKRRQKRFGYVYWVRDDKSRVLLHKRPSRGLLGGMTGLPTSAWVNSKKNMPKPDFIKTTQIVQAGRKNTVKHTFSHFDLELTPVIATQQPAIPGDFFWAEKEELENIGFPSLFGKAYALLKNQPDWNNRPNALELKNADHPQTARRKVKK